MMMMGCYSQRDSTLGVAVGKVGCYSQRDATPGVCDLVPKVGTHIKSEQGEESKRSPWDRNEGQQ